MPDDVVLGFDGTADDVSVVVMRRTPDGTWRVESADDPTDPATDLAARVAELVAAHRPAAPPAPAGDIPPLELVRDWLDRFADQMVTVDPEQMRWLKKWYDSHPLTVRR